MFSFGAKTELQFERVERAVMRAREGNLKAASFLISMDVKSTLQKAEGPSSPGSPPHTHKGVFLRRGIRYEADKVSGVIGPAYSVVGIAGMAHEFGGLFRGSNYPERPFMLPALMRALPQFAGRFSGSVGS